ncbi:MAG: hypothetical protein ABII74_08015 [Elusimicrobiota bacterium]
MINWKSLVVVVLFVGLFFEKAIAESADYKPREFSGIVIDMGTKQPLSEVNIYDERRHIILSDKNGHFKITKYDSDISYHQAMITKLGYDTEYVTLYSTETITIALQKIKANLPDIDKIVREKCQPFWDKFLEENKNSIGKSKLLFMHEINSDNDPDKEIVACLKVEIINDGRSLVSWYWIAPVLLDRQNGRDIIYYLKEPKWERSSSGDSEYSDQNYEFMRMLDMRNDKLVLLQSESSYEDGRSNYIELFSSINGYKEIEKIDIRSSHAYSYFHPFVEIKDIDEDNELEIIVLGTAVDTETSSPPYDLQDGQGYNLESSKYDWDGSKFEKTKYIPKLDDLLKSEDVGLRRYVALALFLTKHLSAIPWLTELSMDKDEDVRRISAQALKNLGDNIKSKENNYKP